MTDPPQLDYEKLDVYRLSIELLRLTISVTSSLPRGESELRSQLKRAAMSVPLNIAEGSGKTSVVDRSRFHAIARGSAMECGALLDVCGVAGYVAEEQARRGRTLVLRVVAMLSRMCR